MSCRLITKSLTVSRFCSNPSAGAFHADGYCQVVPASLPDVEMTVMHYSEGEEAGSNSVGPPPVRLNVRDIAYSAACIVPLYFWPITFLTSGLA